MSGVIKSWDRETVRVMAGCWFAIPVLGLFFCIAFIVDPWMLIWISIAWSLMLGAAGVGRRTAAIREDREWNRLGRVLAGGTIVLLFFLPAAASIITLGVLPAFFSALIIILGLNVSLLIYERKRPNIAAWVALSAKAALICLIGLGIYTEDHRYFIPAAMILIAGLAAGILSRTSNKWRPD